MTPALGVHVSAGLIAIAAGAVAIAARKGGPQHRRAGDAFTAGMLVMGLTAAGIAAGMRRPDLVMGGILAAYPPDRQARRGAPGRARTDTPCGTGF
jgi:hypothetical protein